MNFEEALSALRAGADISRDSWPRGQVLRANLGVRLVYPGSIAEYSWHSALADVAATDWFVVAPEVRHQ